MGGCFGCFRKKDDLNEVNQNDTLLLQTSSFLTTGIQSNMHFSIAGLSNISGQEPAVVTCARKAQEKAEREKAKLETQKKAAASGKSDKMKTKSKAATSGDKNIKHQKLSVETLTKENGHKDKPMKSKTDCQEPIKSTIDGQEPIKNKVSDSQLTNGGEDTRAVVETANQAPLPSENTAEVQLEQEVKAEMAGEASKDMEVSATNENPDKNNIPALPLESVSKPGVEANEVAIETQVQDDAISEPNTDAIKEVDVINQVQSDVSNMVQLDVITKPAIATKPSQVSVTFEMGGEANSAEVRDEDEGGNSFIKVASGNDLVEQSVATETATSPTYVIIDAMVTCDTATDKANNELENSFQDGNTASELVGEPQVASEAQGEKSQEVTSDSQNGQDLTSESRVSNELQNESEVPNQQQEGSNTEKSEEAEDDDETELSWVDMSFSQPLVPQLSEVVRIGVIARVPEEDVITEASNDVASPEAGDQNEVEQNADK